MQLDEFEKGVVAGITGVIVLVIFIFMMSCLYQITQDGCERSLTITYTSQKEYDRDLVNRILNVEGVKDFKYIEYNMGKHVYEITAREPIGEHRN